MGLFSRLVRNIGRIAEDVAPVVLPAVGVVGGGLLLRGILGAQPPTAGGSGAIVQQNLARPGCPSPGFVGSMSPAANPITRAAITPGFDVNRLPARPQFGLLQTLLAQLQAGQPPVPQTTSFRQQGFGQAVSPSFRPFTPSFRSGQPGVQGQFVPGVSQGFAPQFQPPTPRFAPRFARGFGGFGFGGF